MIPVPPKRRAGRARLRLFGPAAAQSERSARVFVTGRRSREGLSAARRGESNMENAVAKIKLSPSRDIPFNKLVLSQANVRRVKAGVSIEQLAESIALRTLLQSLNVRAILDADGKETGMFEVPAGRQALSRPRVVGEPHRTERFHRRDAGPAQRLWSVPRDHLVEAAHVRAD